MAGINYKPQLTEVGGTGYGLFQWSNTSTSDRRAKFEQWCANNGYSLTDGNAQCEYLVQEDFWQRSSQNSFNSLTEFLQSDSADIAYLTESFMRSWEIPSEQYANLQERIEHTNTVYNYLVSHAQDSNITTWITSTTYLPESSTLNNAVMMYRYFSTGGGGGNPLDVSDIMPLWFYVHKKQVIRKGGVTKWR